MKKTVVLVTFNKVSRLIGKYVFPYLDNKPIAEMKAPDALELVLPIAKRQTVETTQRVLNHCQRIFKYAVAHDLMEYDSSPVT